eukprot:15479718-Alexandrium_andersonii.AAC.1
MPAPFPTAAAQKEPLLCAIAKPNIFRRWAPAPKKPSSTRGPRAHAERNGWARARTRTTWPTP